MHSAPEPSPIGGDWDEYLDEFLALAAEETNDLRRAVVPSETAATLDQVQAAIMSLRREPADPDDLLVLRDALANYLRLREDPETPSVGGWAQRLDRMQDLSKELVELDPSLDA